MASDKDTIYIDVDDEITGIIDKLQGSGAKVVSLVLPKRAAVFQSIVNMKLLKRAADGADKRLVLVTTEAGLLPLAGLAGIHVAKTLNSKPEIPRAPQLADDIEETVDEGAVEGLTAATAGDQAIGDLAGKPPADTGVETLTLDDDSLPPESTANMPGAKTFEPPAAAKGKGKGKKDKKLSIPDFNRFRLLLIGGILLFILLILFLFMAIKVWPKATITIDTGAQTIDSNLTLNLSTTAKSLDPDGNVVPAKLAQQQKTYTQSSATTGQKNNGNKASGSVTLTNCIKQDGDITIPAGTGLVSGGNTFISQTAVTVSESTFNSGGKCTSHPSATVNVLAQSPGSAYNGATGFTVSSPYSGITGTGSTSGGTDNIVRSVNQNDINNAKAQINTNDPSVKKNMQDELKGAGYFTIDATYNASTPVVSTSANVGAVADTVAVTETVTYSLFGVHKDDLKTLVDTNVESQIDTAKQKVQDEGIDRATFNVSNTSNTGAQVTMSAKAVAGPDIDVASIQKNAMGQKAGKVKDDLEGNPGIKSVRVNLSPFWVTTVPKKTSKIKVVIAQPKTASNNNDKTR